MRKTSEKHRHSVRKNETIARMDIFLAGVGATGCIADIIQLAGGGCQPPFGVECKDFRVE